MKDQELLEQISKKLSALLALSFVGDITKMTAADGVKLLMRFELSNQDIADILGTTRRSVEVMKSRALRHKKIARRNRQHFEGYKDRR